MLDFYFDLFLQSMRKANRHDYIKEIDRYNETIRQYGDMAEDVFLRGHQEISGVRSAL